MIHLPGKLLNLAVVLFCMMVGACNSNPQSQKTVADSTTALPVPRQQNGIDISLLDKSPMDIIYYPSDYPKLKMLGKATSLPVFRVLYSRPQKNGRKIFGEVVKYGEHWRLGANEATEIEFFEDVSIQQTRVSKGRYMLYCIPQPTEWTLIINSNLYSWGLKIDWGKDIFKFTVPTIHNNAAIEAFTMETEKSNETALLWIGWDDTKVSLPIQLIAK